MSEGNHSDIGAHATGMLEVHRALAEKAVRLAGGDRVNAMFLLDRAVDVHPRRVEMIEALLRQAHALALRSAAFPQS